MDTNIIIQALDNNQAVTMAKEFGNQNLANATMDAGSKWLFLGMDLAKISPAMIGLLIVEVIAFYYIFSRFLGKGIGSLIIAIIAVCAFVFPISVGVVFP